MKEKIIKFLVDNPGSTRKDFREEFGKCPVKVLTEMVLENIISKEISPVRYSVIKSDTFSYPKIAKMEVKMPEKVEFTPDVPNLNIDKPKKRSLWRRIIGK